MPFAKPLARTREYVKIVRDIVARKGPRHERRARTTRCRYPNGTGLGKPLQVDDPPGARGHPDLPRRRGPEERRARGRDLRRLAGALLLAAQRRTSTATRSRRASRATGARRSWDDFEVAATVPVIIHDDVEQAADFLRPMYALYFGGMGARGANFHHDVAVRLGYEAEAKQIQDLYLDGKKDEAAAAVPTRARRGAGADRPRGQDPRRPRGVARVDRDHAAGRRRRRHAAPDRRAGARRAVPAPDPRARDIRPSVHERASTPGS